MGRVTKLTDCKVEFDWENGTYSSKWKEWRGMENGMSLFLNSVQIKNVTYMSIHFFN